MTIGSVLANDRQWHVETCDCRAGLALLPDDSVHCVMTSVPYWGLRDYGLEPVVWGGSECIHDWVERKWYTQSTAAASCVIASEAKRGRVGIG